MLCHLAFFLYLCSQMRKSIFAILSLIVFAGILHAQNNTSSPYSRFGYGEINDNVSGAYRALGGVGIGMRNNHVINPSQPASFTACDSMTFMFDIGASAMWSNYKDATGNRNRGNGNLEYLTMQFPIWRQWIAMSLGVLPYSMVGYNIVDSAAINDDYHYKTYYQGTGGITQIYGGLSFNICNWFAVGANIYYMFGDVENVRSLVFNEASLNSVSQTSNLHASDIRFRFGAQFFHTFAEKHTIVLGGMYEYPKKFNGTFTQIETTTTDTVQNLKDGFGLPMVYGAGFSYNYAGRLTIAADYQMQDWNNALFFGKSGQDDGALRSRMKISFGAEYIHNPQGRKYYEHMPFRIGCSVSDSYIMNMTAKDFGVSIGVGFPLHNVATIINTTIEYNHRGSVNTLSENSLKFTINASIAENWFFKRKL